MTINSICNHLQIDASVCENIFLKGLVVRKGNCIQENFINLNGMHFKWLSFMRKRDVTSLTFEFVSPFYCAENDEPERVCQTLSPDQTVFGLVWYAMDFGFNRAISRRLVFSHENAIWIDWNPRAISVTIISKTHFRF